MAMAAAYHLTRPDNGPSALAPNVHVNLYPRGFPLNDIDFGDNRYPTLNSSSVANRRVSALPTGPADTFARDSGNDGTPRVVADPAGRFAAEAREAGPMRSGARLHPVNGLAKNYQQAQLSKLEAVVSYASSAQADTTRRVVERCRPDDNNKDDLPPSYTPSVVEPPRDESVTTSQQQGAGLSASRERPNTMLPSTPWHTSPLPTAGVGAGLGNRDSAFSPIVPFSGSPSFNRSAMSIPVPISPKPRAYVQQPTYVIPSSAPNPINPVYLSNPPPRQEDVCVECAMRDQDMADVDVTSPGVWERESDALYEDLVRPEQEEEVSEVLSSDSHKSNRSNRPRAKGGRLSESNLKLWLSVNPREPQARQQTLHLYLKTQRALLEAEILAHARAMQESRQLDTRMRDTYSQLRRSAYDTGMNSALADDSGGVRIMTPRSAAARAHGHSQSREVTLLENGLIVEHVNVRKEEREERERRRKEEKRERSRARKSSRGSAYSAHSLVAPATDGELGLRPHTRYSGSSSARPTSVGTTNDRPPSFPRAYSQASFSDVHSLGSGSPRQRFFGFKNLSSGWRSRDSLAPSGMSGSMVDMHVALQREGFEQRIHSPVDLGSQTPSLRQSQVWPGELPQIRLDEMPKKKKKGLAKIWDTLIGSKKSSSQGGSYNEHLSSFDRAEDDLPLAPPPPLSYLVERGPGEHSIPITRQSTISLPSTTSPKNVLSSPAISPGTAPSSLLPSPTSSRPSNGELESMGDLMKLCWNPAELERAGLLTEEGSKSANPRNLLSIPSEPDIRRMQQESPNTSSSLTVPKPFSASRPQSILSREKSLPPLPLDENIRPPVDQPDQRPHTVYTYNPRQRPPGASPPVQDLAAPRAPFYAAESRRQSLGGLTSRPNVTTQTLPAKGVYAQEFMPPSRYDEFGISRRSLGYLEHIEEKQAIPRSATPSKRKSKFGLATLLGRKSQIYDRDILASPDLSASRRSTSDGRDDVLSNGGYTNSASRHSAGPRMSVVSRKAIEELVSQDPNFIAYRYPSNDQRLDLLR